MLIANAVKLCLKSGLVRRSSVTSYSYHFLHEPSGSYLIFYGSHRGHAETVRTFTAIKSGLMTHLRRKVRNVNVGIWTITREEKGFGIGDTTLIVERGWYDGQKRIYLTVNGILAYSSLLQPRREDLIGLAWTCFDLNEFAPLWDFLQDNELIKTTV